MLFGMPARGRGQHPQDSVSVAGTSPSAMSSRMAPVHLPGVLISTTSRPTRRVVIPWGMSLATMFLVFTTNTGAVLLLVLQSTGPCRGTPPFRTPL